MERDLSRYVRQTALQCIGRAGQERLLESKVAIIGCGATGSVIANALARSGVGSLRIVDRDVVEPDNLQRQLLFDEGDIGHAKATIAGKRLRKIDPSLEVHTFVDDVVPDNIASLTEGVDLIMDATDNMSTRFLVNEHSVKAGVPWVYTGVVETMGMTMDIVPGKTACLRCALPSIPPAGTLPTCASVGIINTIPSIMGSIASTEAIKLLLDKDWSREMVVFDVWKGFYDRFLVKRRDDCECCAKGQFELLEGGGWTVASKLCGGNAVQIGPPPGPPTSLKSIAERLRPFGEVKDHGELIRAKVDGFELVIFRGGRTIVHGTDDEKVARSLVSKYMGD